MINSNVTHKRTHSFLRSAPARLGAILLLFLSTFPAIHAQEVADTIKIRTRVVFMDALVKDKKTGIPITDLKPDNFELFDDGKPRTISYFTREGQARKPLALVLILDCREDGAGRFLKRPEVIQAITEQLSKLPPDDEIGIMAMNIGEDEHRVWLTRFSNKPVEITAALARVPGFVEKPEQVTAEMDKERKERKQSEASVTVDAKTEQQKPSETQPDAKQEVASTETIKGKNGAVVTRTVMKDGSVNIKRVNSKGDVTVEFDDVYDMAAAVREATQLAEKERPNSKPAIIWLSDGIAPIFYEDRDATEQILIRSNATFSSLTTDLRTLFKFLMPIGKPIAGWLGVSLYGSAKYLAQQTGGEALRVNRPKDYGTGLARIMGNLTARYSLGFALAEDEKDDGRMHELAVRVKARDEKGKDRRLEVSSRRGYFMPKTETEQAAATK
ncbi:MAG TPA: VWA domain-containing protein [Pyrinomonadaceae bacterium]|nr:VWA domain-containing protein [Pyrinomonadaceae bacterium]